MNRRTAILLAFALPLATHVLAGQWTVRYAAFPSATEEQKDQGWVPTWTVDVEDAERPVFHMYDNETGSAMGHVLFGMPLEPFKRLPRQLRVRFELQMNCSTENRAGNMCVYLLSQSAWEKLSTEPGTRTPLPSFRASECFAKSAFRSPGNEDITEWQSWESTNLAAGLTRARGKPLVLAVGFTGFHASGKENAKMRNVTVDANSAPPPPVERTSQFPLKTARTLHTAEEIVQAQANVAASKAAASVQRNYAAKAKSWLERSDDEILALIPPATVPRAFNVSVNGCPVHGKAIYEFSTYPWILREDEPYVIECPVGHETYPSNDYATFLRSGFQAEDTLTGAHVDDGWGWVGPDSERYWLVGYACHWHWHKFVIPGVLALSRTYLLTGDPDCAHKGALMLATIAKDYPNFDYANQSRYGQLQGGRYHGKILNHIWETGTFRSLAEAYDNLWDVFDQDANLQAHFNTTGKALRGMIEAHLLEEGIEGIFSHKIQGNFGMHQSALATAAIVRQQGPVDDWLGEILTSTDRGAHHTGLNYALYNLVYRDGMPNETAPGYCSIWPNRIIGMASVLKKGGIDLFELPKLKSLVTAPIDLVCVDRFTPDEGDSGSVTGGIVGRNADVYQPAYHAYHDPRIYDWLETMDAAGDNSFRTYDSLFTPPIVPVDADTPIPTPRLMDGYGMALLCNNKNTLGLAMYYGYRGGHSHCDTLNFDLYAHGCKMMPDLGYPDFMNAYVSGIFTWSKNTISHNCVMIDRQRQTGNGPGSVELFMSVGGVHAVDISAPSAYPGCREYRRGLILIETGPDTAYVIDITQVAGGDEHHYSLHGPPGEFTILGGKWSEPAPGTLAGADIAVGVPYDDPVLGEPGYQGSFGPYKGSGFSHFTNVRTHQAGEWVAQYAHFSTPGSKLQLRVPAAEDQEILLADAQVSPLKHKEIVTYVLDHRQGEDLSSVFVGLFEPFRRSPTVQAVRRHDVPDGVVIEVQREGATDTVLFRTGGDSPLSCDGISTNGRLAVVTRTGSQADRAILNGGTNLKAGELEIQHQPSSGKVVAIDPLNCSADVRFATAVEAGSLIGQFLGFSRGERTVWHRVTAAEPRGDAIRLNVADDLLIGRAKVGSVEGNTVKTPVAFTFPPIYPGCAAADETFEHIVGVKSVGTTITLSEPFPDGALTDDNDDGVTDIWFCSFGPGATVTLPTVTAITRR
ncbi:MAG: hypothetical protein HN742_26700 [Lentisphaerae bacterium]|nr:hypothetical protein [Lentisphaerota bacterium]MBT5604618.1 hypothetical protein [Lentisphaerota bacterium]MBT7057420.1 hypothetical protein [Lentisphaerota bacterium]MBT7845493.1 hypothetical protein [Lentisphaerota bacterium]